MTTSSSGAGGLLRSSMAPAPRTLLDILEATTAAHPDAPAIDDGATTLSYRELLAGVRVLAARLAADGVGPGDRVGIRLPSGTHTLYTAILGVLAAGAAYVPVDADDPDERAALVFGEAAVKAVVDPSSPVLDPDSPMSEPSRPATTDDAWIIFTSGSTGVPKGVAVSHRNAAAFVDAEARLFLQERPTRTRGPRARRPLGRLRRVLRGDVAGLALRGVSRSGTAFARAERHRPRPVAGQPAGHRGLDGAHARRPLAAGLAGRCPAVDLRR